MQSTMLQDIASLSTKQISQRSESYSIQSPSVALAKPLKFRGSISPFKHQEATTRFIIENERCFVFNDIGTGKTLSTAWAIDNLIENGEVRSVLIVAPLSTLQIVWFRTLFRVMPDADIKIVTGSAKKRIAMINDALDSQNTKAKIRIINPDALHIIADCDALEKYDLVVVDESALFRNSRSRRYKALEKITAHIPRLVCMSGEPMPEAPTDVWATARLVCPERVPRYFSHFREQVMVKISQWLWQPRRDAEARVAEALKGYVIRFTRDECLDLPPTQTITIECEPSEAQKKHLAELRALAHTMIEDGEISAANEAVVIGKMLQVTSGVVKGKDSSGEEQHFRVDCESKIAALEDIINSTKRPIIVYASYLGAIALLKMRLDELKLPHRIITGETSPDERTESFDAVQTGKVRVLVAHPRTMAHGVTLTNSNVIVWWSPVFSHETYAQACGRIVRAGQTRNTLIYHLICSGVERRVLSKLETKQKMQGVLLDYLERGDV